MNQKYETKQVVQNNKVLASKYIHIFSIFYKYLYLRLFAAIQKIH